MTHPRLFKSRWVEACWGFSSKMARVGSKIARGLKKLESPLTCKKAREEKLRGFYFRCRAFFYAKYKCMHPSMLSRKFVWVLLCMCGVNYVEKNYRSWLLKMHCYFLIVLKMKPLKVIPSQKITFHELLPAIFGLNPLEERQEMLKKCFIYFFLINALLHAAAVSKFFLPRE